jgi:hypothetical protein
MHIDGMSRAAGLRGNAVGAVFPREVEFFFIYILMVYLKYFELKGFVGVVPTHADK